MTKIWLSLKSSLHCKSQTSDVHDPNPKTRLPRQPGIRPDCSYSKSFNNLKDAVINTGRRISSDKPPICSPRSIGSSDFLHHVILSNPISELNSVSSTPKKSSPLVMSSDSEGGFGRTSKRFSIEVDLNGDSCCGSCCKCGEKVSKLDDAEFHHVSKHAVTELVEGDSSRKIVEIICRTSWMMKPEKNYYNSRIVDKVLKVHNTHKTLARFEEYRESVKMRASKLPKKHPRCLADGNELLRFYATTLSCSLGFSTSTTTTTTTCLSEDCCVCRIIRNGFSVKEEVKNGTGIGIFTTATSGRALESVEDGGGEKKRRVLIVCRVIAGRVHRPIENVKDMVGLQNGFDSLAGKLGVYSNIEELYLLNPSSLLPCFVVICRP